MSSFAAGELILRSMFSAISEFLL